MKRNAITKVLLCAVLTVSLMPTVTTYAAPNTGKVTSAQECHERATNIDDIRNYQVEKSSNTYEDRYASSVVNPKTGLLTTRYTDDNGKPFVGLHQRETNGGVEGGWTILDEDGFCGIYTSKITINGKTYVTIGSSQEYGVNTAGDGTSYFLVDDKSMGKDCHPYMIVSDGWGFEAKWYHTDVDGVIQTNQWIKDGKDWFYLGADGAMATDTVISGYTIGKDGKMI